jgi:hypothetical protein
VAAPSSSPAEGNSSWGLRTRLKKRREESDEHRYEKKQLQAIVTVAITLAVPALAGLLLYVTLNSVVFAFGLLAAAAAFATGALLGFLFGIPRARQVEGEGDTSKLRYAPNTNLEQISDWLTKILVGVGLVQINQLGHAVNTLADGLENGLEIGDTEAGHAVAIMLLVSFAIAGFMTSYLFTRLRLQRDFEPFQAALKEQEEALTNALPMVRAQLDPSGEVDPSVTELAEALSAASAGIRDEAFYLARNQRRDNWRGKRCGGKKALVELVIPVFEALIALDDEHVWHRNYGELAFALKDKRKAMTVDYQRARSVLDTAIKIRETTNAGAASRFPMYEFNRAYCNMKLDPALATGAKTAEGLAAAICVDLEAAAMTEAGQKAIREDKLVELWLQQNSGSGPIGERIAHLL